MLTELSKKTIIDVCKFIIIASFVFFTISCGNIPDAQSIVHKAVEKHGGENYKHAEIEFDFRGKHYQVIREEHHFKYQRFYYDSLNKKVIEGITDSSVFKFSDGKKMDLIEKEKSKIYGSVNSIIYFSLLPFPLNDPAVIKKFIGTSRIKGNGYYKIEVTFRENGGGEDFDDRYVYWFNKTTGIMDYLSYYFHVNGGGSRFRSAYNARRKGGILFVDYDNYSSDRIGTDVENYDKLFEQGALKKVSEIKLENVKVLNSGR